MVKRNKKDTKDTPKKKTKASTSMDDSRKDLSVDFDTSVSLSQSPQVFQPVSTSLTPTSEGVTMQSSHNPFNHATILAYLKKIDASNEALAKSVQDLEASKTGVQSQSIVANSETPLNLHLPSGAQASAMTLNTRQPQVLHQISGLFSHDMGHQGVQDTAQYFSHDGVMPDINILCQNPQISQSVSQILTAFDVQVQQDSFQGKIVPTKKSGRFNSTDTVTTVPELRGKDILGLMRRKEFFMMICPYLNGR